MCDDRTPESPQLKQCTKCKEWKPATLEYFPPRKDAWDGLRTRCKPCNHERVRRNQLANREYLLEYGRRYNATHKEERRAKRAANRERIAAVRRAYNAAHREQRAAYIRAWRIANQEHVAAYARAYGEANKQRKRAWKRNWHVANTEKVRVHIRTRRARILGAEGTHTAEDIKLQYKNQRGKCYYCGVSVGETFHVDHIVPLSRGGSNDPSNLVIACRSCNISKKDKLPHEWPKGGRLL